MRIGYYPGTWDLFHSGHVEALRIARLHVDSLCVGIPTDDVVERDKGEPPIIKCEHRVMVVRNSFYVNRVLIYPSLNFLPNLEEAGASILFTGPDWGKEQRHVNAERYVKEREGEVIRIPYTSGISTTAIKKKIRGEL